LKISMSRFNEKVLYVVKGTPGANSLQAQETKSVIRPRKKERLRLPSPAACIKERSPVLKGRAPPHRINTTGRFHPIKRKNNMDIEKASKLPNSAKANLKEPGSSMQYMSKHMTGA